MCSPRAPGTESGGDSDALDALVLLHELRWIDLMSGRIPLSHLRESLADPVPATETGIWGDVSTRDGTHSRLVGLSTTTMCDEDEDKDREEGARS